MHLTMRAMNQLHRTGVAGTTTRLSSIAMRQPKRRLLQSIAAGPPHGYLGRAAGESRTRSSQPKGLRAAQNWAILVPKSKPRKVGRDGPLRPVARRTVRHNGFL